MLVKGAPGVNLNYFCGVQMHCTTVETYENVAAVIYKLKQNYLEKYWTCFQKGTVCMGISRETLSSLNYVASYEYTFIVLHEWEQSILRWLTLVAFQLGTRANSKTIQCYVVKMTPGN